MHIRCKPKLYLSLIGLTLCATLLSACGRSERPRDNVLSANGAASLTVMDFSKPLSLDPITPGWFHRQFKRHGPMDISLVVKDNKPSVRLATKDSASMLFRMVDIPIDEYPVLSWDWFIEQGINAEFDEMTSDGDDHPARFFLTFQTLDNEKHAMEIVWGNDQLSAGDWKHLSYFFGRRSFPHYTANGGSENIGKWFSEQVDLKSLFSELWGDADGVRLTEIALFCDTDETDASSIAYFSNVVVSMK